MLIAQIYVVLSKSKEFSRQARYAVAPHTPSPVLLATPTIELFRLIDQSTPIVDLCRWHDLAGKVSHCVAATASTLFLMSLARIGTRSNGAW